MGVASSKRSNNIPRVDRSDRDQFFRDVNSSSFKENHPFLKKYFQMISFENDVNLYCAINNTAQLRKILHRTMKVAIYRGYLQVIKILLRIDIMDLQSREFGMSLLEYARNENYCLRAYDLLKAHAEKNPLPLLTLAREQQTKTGPLGATASKEAQTKFLNAALSGNLNDVQDYLENHVRNSQDLNVTTSGGDTALHLAAACKHFKIVQALLNYKPPKNLLKPHPELDLNHYNNCNYSALYRAMLSRDINCVRLLLSDPRMSQSVKGKAILLFSDFYKYSSDENKLVIQKIFEEIIIYTLSSDYAPRLEVVTTPPAVSTKLTESEPTVQWDIFVPEDTTENVVSDEVNIPNDFQDHIAGDGRIMREPVLASTGFAYDALSLKRYLAFQIQHGKPLLDPISEQPLKTLGGMPLTYEHVLKKTLADDGKEKYEIVLDEFMPVYTLRSAINCFVEASKQPQVEKSKNDKGKESDEYQDSVTLLQSSMDEYKVSKLQKAQAKHDLEQALHQSRQALTQPVVTGASASSSSSSSSDAHRSNHSSFWDYTHRQTHNEEVAKTQAPKSQKSP